MSEHRLVITASVSIQRPPEDVWAALDDLSLRPTWQHAVIAATAADGQHLHAQSEVVERRKVFGRTVTLGWRVTTWEPPLRRGFEVTSGLAHPIGTWLLAETADGGTRLVTSADYRTNRRTRAVGGLLGGRLRQEEQHDLEALKLLLESDPHKPA